MMEATTLRDRFTKSAEVESSIISNLTAINYKAFLDTDPRLPSAFIGLSTSACRQCISVPVQKRRTISSMRRPQVPFAIRLRRRSRISNTSDSATDTSCGGEPARSARARAAETIGRSPSRRTHGLPPPATRATAVASNAALTWSPA